jgi:hypothetical protein
MMMDLLEENQRLASQLRETQAGLDVIREDHFNTQVLLSEVSKQFDDLKALIAKSFPELADVKHES